MRKILAKLATVAVAAIMATGLTLPFGNHVAMAAIGDCPSGEFCWWTNSNYTGAWGHRTWQNISGLSNHCWSMGASGNTMSSFYNRLTYSNFYLWDAGNCTGGPFAYVTNNVANPSITGYNDQVGGVQWLS